MVVVNCVMCAGKTGAFTGAFFENMRISGFYDARSG